MQMNALRSANLVKLSSRRSTSDAYWVGSISAGTPGGYCLSQMRSMENSPQLPEPVVSRACLIAGSIEPAGTGGKPSRLKTKVRERLLESSQTVLPQVRSAGGCLIPDGR